MRITAQIKHRLVRARVQTSILMKMSIPDKEANSAMNVSDQETLSASWLITEAFDGLLGAVPFERITVDAIVRKAGISRSTFYLHFQDKFDLLEQVTERIIGQLAEMYGTGRIHSEWFKLPETNVENEMHAQCLAICEHVRAHSNFYRNRFRDPVFLHRLSELLRSGLKHVYVDDRHAAFAAYGTVGVFGSWLASDLAASAEEVAKSLTAAAIYSVPDLRKKRLEEEAAPAP